MAPNCMPKRTPRFSQALLTCAMLAACLPILAVEARPIKGEVPVDTYEPAGSWLKIDTYNYINPVKGQVLRFYEGLEVGYEDSWAAYLIDLKARRVKKLCELSKPFVESTGKEPSSTDFNIQAAALTPAGDKLLLECVEGSFRLGRLTKGADPNSWTRKVFALSLPSGGLEELFKTSMNSNTHGNLYYWAGNGNFSLDPRTLALWISSWDASLNFNATRIDLQKGSRSVHLLEKPKANYIANYGSSLTVLADGSLVYLFENEIKRIKWNDQKVEKWPLPPGSWFGNVAATAEGEGLLTISMNQTPQGETSTMLWMLDSAKGKTWRKVGELPTPYFYNYGYQFYQRGLCADQAAAWLVLQKVNPNSWGWSHGWGYGGYGGSGNPSKYQILSMDLKTGAVKVVWRNHDVDAIFYAGLPEATPEKRPVPIDLGDVKIGPLQK